MGAFPRLLSALFLAIAATTSKAQEGRLEVPKNDGWVTDLAGILSTTKEGELESLMESYRRGTTHEIALLTIPSLQGESIERFALEVGRAWGLGTKEKNNGALLVVSKEDRKIRIEVGRGLEGNLTDSIAGRIIRDVIAPEFKRGKYDDGLEKGIVAMHEAIGGNYAKLQRAARSPSSGLAGIIPAFVILMIVLAVLSRRRRGGHSGGGSVLPWLLMSSMGSGGGRSGGGGGGFSGFGGGGGFSGGGASGGW